MLLSEFDITIDTKLVQAAKALSLMLLTESGITIDERLKHGKHCTNPRGVLLLA